MISHQIYDDESKPLETKFSELEQLLDAGLPVEYRSFLERYNGFTILPNTPTISADTRLTVWPIIRCLSVGDLLLQSKTDVIYFDKEYIRENDGHKYSIDIDKLITFAFSERGTYLIYLGDEDKGRIYSTCYSDGDGLVDFNTVSFKEFIESLGYFDSSDDERVVPKLERSIKIFDRSLFNTPKIPELGLERFKEVLAEYGDPNVSLGDGYKNVTETYVHNYTFLEYILSQSGKTEGLLNSCRDFKTIKLLVEEYKEDINKPFNGIYPIHSYAGGLSPHDDKVAYELIDCLLKSNIDVDLTVVDSSSVDFKTKLKKVDEGYRRYLKYGGRHSGEHVFSERIEKIICR